MLLVAVPLIVWLCAFELAPVARMVQMSFQFDDGQGFTLGQYVKSLTNPLYVRAIANSLRISLEASLAALAIGLVCAYSVTRMPAAVGDKLLMLSNTMSNFVGVPLAFAYIIMLGNNGALVLLFKHLGLNSLASFDLYSEQGILLLYIYYQIPLALLLLYPLYRGVRREWMDASALLGAPAWKFWLHIGLPVMLPGILGTFSVLMANALGAYATAYALTGSNYNLMPIRISSLVAGEIFPNFQLSSALSILLALMMVLTIAINEWMSRWSRRKGL